MKEMNNIAMLLLLAFSQVNCSGPAPAVIDDEKTEITDETGNSNNSGNMGEHLTTSDYVRDIVNHPAFEGFGELLLARDNNSSYYDTRLSNVGSLMPYHGNVRPDVVVSALNRMIDEVGNGKTVFYTKLGLYVRIIL